MTGAEPPSGEAEQRNVRDIAASISRQFYDRYPAGYFSQITRVAVSSLVDPVESLRPLSEGVIVPGDSAAGEDDGQLKYKLDSDTVDVEGVRTAAKILISNTYHHAAETMLRLYFAHRSEGDSPWLDLTRLVLPKFKRQTEEIRDWQRGKDEDLDLRSVFLLPDERSDEFDEALRRNVRSWLQLAANECIEPYMYNAWNHGLGISQHATQFSFHPQEESGSPNEPLFDEKGEIILNLAREAKSAEGTRSWVQERRFVRIRERIISIQEFQRCIDGIIRVGQTRHAGNSSRSLSLPSFSPNDVVTLTTGGRPRVSKWSTGLGVRDTADGGLELEHPIEIKVEMEFPPSMTSWARERGVEPEDGTELSIGG